MFKYTIVTSLLIWVLISFTSCSSDPVVLDPQPNITLLTYTLSPIGGGQTVVFTYEDEDATGGSGGLVTGGTLSISTMYEGEIELFTTSNDSLVNITESIRQDGRDNQFFYTNLNPALVVSYDDSDVDLDGKPIGILTNLNTVNNSGDGTLTLTLKHNPDKDGIGVSGGNVSLSKGRTDLAVDFPVSVQ